MRIPCPVAISAALPLAACSGQPATDPAAPSPSPASSPAAAPTPTPAATSTTDLAAAAPDPGETRTFGDWTVGCDNVRICTMASLGPESADFPPMTLALTRQPGGDGGWEIAADALSDNDTVRLVGATVDGRRIALPRLDGPPAAALVAAIANGRSLTPVDAASGSPPVISLRGAAAALRWIDAQQGRAGTKTAVVAKGPQPAAAVPPRRPAPIIAALTPAGNAPTPTAAQVAAMRRQAGCDDRIIRNAGLKPATHALGGGATLVLLPCSTGAYNLSQTLFVLRDGKVAAARIDAPSGFGPTPAAGTDALPSVVNGEWVEGELREFPRGRGLGDCGVKQAYVWDGTRLRLSGQSVMGECRGNANFLTTWRTQVVRR